MVEIGKRATAGTHLCEIPSPRPKASEMVLPRPRPRSVTKEASRDGYRRRKAARAERKADIAELMVVQTIKPDKKPKKFAKVLSSLRREVMAGVKARVREEKAAAKEVAVKERVRVKVEKAAAKEVAAKERERVKAEKAAAKEVAKAEKAAEVEHAKEKKRIAKEAPSRIQAIIIGRMTRTSVQEMKIQEMEKELRRRKEVERYVSDRGLSRVYKWRTRNRKREHAEESPAQEEENLAEEEVADGSGEVEDIASIDCWKRGVQAAQADKEAAARKQAEEMAAVAQALAEESSDWDWDDGREDSDEEELLKRDSDGYNWKDSADVGMLMRQMRTHEVGNWEATTEEVMRLGLSRGSERLMRNSIYWWKRRIEEWQEEQEREIWDWDDGPGGYIVYRLTGVLEQLMQMGFSRVLCEQALRKTGGCVERRITKRMVAGRKRVWCTPDLEARHVAKEAAAASMAAAKKWITRRRLPRIKRRRMAGDGRVVQW